MLVVVLLEVVDDDLKWLVGFVVVGAAFHRRNQLYSVRCGLAARTDDRAQDTTRTHARRGGARLIHTVKRAGRGNREGGEGLCL